MPHAASRSTHWQRVRVFVRSAASISAWMSPGVAHPGRNAAQIAAAAPERSGRHTDRPLAAVVDGSVHLWTLRVMKSVKIAELKSQLSRHLRAVERGEEIEVTDRDRPIARIVPVTRRSTLRIEKARVPVESLRSRRPRPAGWSIDSTELLLQDRRSR